MRSVGIRTHIGRDWFRLIYYGKLWESNVLHVSVNLFRGVVYDVHDRYGPRGTDDWSPRRGMVPEVDMVP